MLTRSTITEIPIGIKFFFFGEMMGRTTVDDFFSSIISNASLADENRSSFLGFNSFRRKFENSGVDFTSNRSNSSVLNASTFFMHSVYVEPSKILSPLNTSTNVTPRANRSVRASTSSPRTCSGAIYAGVPRTIPSIVTVGDSATYAKPKSVTFSVPFSERRIFPGLMSR